MNINSRNIITNPSSSDAGDGGGGGVNLAVSYCDIFWSMISILSRIVGILMNVNVAYAYYRNEKINYFIWTIICLAVPMIATTFIQIAMYMQDRNSTKLSWGNNKKFSSFGDFLCFVIIIPFLFRYCQSVSYAIASKRAERSNNKMEQKRYYELLVHEDSDIALIRIFECFLEAAPQKILQISIILSGEDDINIPQMLAILSSLLSMAWCIASYHRCIRISQIDKQKLTWLGTIIQWFFYFSISVSRVLSIAIVASLFPKWTLIACTVHAILMGLWIYFYDKSPFCSSSDFHSFVFSIVLGLVFIFNYILPKVRRTRYRYTIFYFICFAENCICTWIFINYSQPNMREENYFIALCILSIGPFLLGILFMILYYTHFHPNVMLRRRIPIIAADKMDTTVINNADVGEQHNIATYIGST